MAFDLQKFRAKRVTKWWIGVCVFWGSLGLMLLDMFTPFPTPERGAYALYWLIFMAVGAFFWILSKRLPVEEAMSIASLNSYRGELTISDLAGELYVTVGTSRAILDKAVIKGHATSEKRDDIMIWIFPEIKQKFENPQGQGY
jgi:hypothetical protein